MDEAVVAARLEALRRCVQRVRDHTPGSAEALEADEDLQDIVSLNLERAVQACVEIAAHLVSRSDESPPQTMGEGFDALRRLGVIPGTLAASLRKAVGYRNISVHAYGDVDWDLVYALITTRLDDFRDFARHVTAWLGEGPPEPRAG